MECHTVIGDEHRSSGFTLIELLVVLLIIGGLLTIAAPRYFSSVDKSKEVVLAQDLSILRDALDQYYGDRGVYPSVLSELADARYVRQIPVDPMTKSAESWVTLFSQDGGIEGIVDVRSGSEGVGRDGRPYNEW
jgi:general secretion pathway protein G